MGYEFRVVDISVLDFHLAVAPKMKADSFQPAFGFLNNEAGYNAAYKSGQEIDTAGLRFKPLSRRIINHHRFWRHYHRIRERGGEPNYWNVQMPFVGRPKQAAVELKTDSPNFAAEVWPTVFLTAMGWSTNLKIRLRGKMTAQQLSEFVGRLGDEKNPPFRLGGAAVTLRQVFISFAQQMKKEVYTPQVEESLKLNRHIIVSLSRYSGVVYTYQGKWKGAQQMTLGDRAALHGILLGREVDAAELLKLEGKDQAGGDGANRKGFLLTLFPDDRGGGTDFALTHFDRGTLLFMQQIASEEGNRWRDDPPKWKRRLNSIQCHTANVRHYLMMTLAMLEFYNDTKEAAENDAAIKSLRDNIRLTLIRLPRKYSGRFCQSFHKYFGRLKEFKDKEPRATA